VRRTIAQNERHHVAGSDGELAVVGQIPAVKWHGRAHYNLCLSGDRDQGAVFIEALDPGHDRAVVEAQGRAGSVCSATLPRTPRTKRTRLETPSQGGMKSISSTTPSVVSKVVMRMSEPSR
jgi:hypothetical protein